MAKISDENTGNTIRTFDMFSGAGGFRSGIEPLGGFTFVGWCEIDKYAQQAYRALYDTEGEYFCDDATKIITAEMPDFDLVTAGFPCQPFSATGKRLGFEDDRGNLFAEIVRIASARLPAFLLLENVPGLVFHEGGRTLRHILDRIHGLGYTLEFAVLDSKDFGVPQQRKRIYIAGYLDARCAGKILLSKRPGGKDPPGCGKKEAPEEAGRPAGQRDADPDLIFIDLNRDAAITDNARCLTARYDGGIGRRRWERSGVLDCTGPRAIFSPDRTNPWQNGRRVKMPGDPMFTLTASDRHGIIHEGRVRRLMPAECMRLQGYTDEQFKKLKEAGISDSQIYRMAGNSVTVNVVREIGASLKKICAELDLPERR